MADRKRKQSSSSFSSYYYKEQMQQQEYYRKRNHHVLRGFNINTIITPQSADSSLCNSSSSYYEEQIQQQEYYRERNDDVLRGFSNNTIITPQSASSSNPVLQQCMEEKGPLGLRLSLSASEVNKLLQKQQLLPPPQNYKNTQQMINTTTTQQQQQQIIINKQQQPHHHKLKVSNIPAVYLEIGNWKRKSSEVHVGDFQYIQRKSSEVHVGDLTAKFYYGRKQLVWEFLDGNLKKKIEIGWSQITAINSSYLHQNKTTRLQIQLKERPKLYQEVNFELQKNTKWAIANDDFTNGQASICMHHTIVFRGREVDDAYMKLLQCDNRLLALSQHPSRYPTGFKNVPQILDFSCNEIVRGCSAIVPNNHNLAAAQEQIKSSNHSEDEISPKDLNNAPTEEIISPDDFDGEELVALLEDRILEY